MVCCNTLQYIGDMRRVGWWGYHTIPMGRCTAQLTLGRCTALPSLGKVHSSTTAVGKVHSSTSSGEGAQLHHHGGRCTALPAVG